jgi:hypothetical protein
MIICLSLVVVLGLSGIASANLTDDFAGTQGGTWAPIAWKSTGSYIAPSGGELYLNPPMKGAHFGELDMDLASGTIASNIDAGGGLAVEFDTDSISGSHRADAWFYLGGWRETYKYFQGGMVHSAGLYKYEFTITSGTWGSGSVDTSVKAWQDTGSGWVEFTPQTSTYSFNTDNRVYSQFKTYQADPGGNYMRWRLGNDLEGGLGFNIYALPEPASAVLLLIGLPMLARRRRI